MPNSVQLIWVMPHQHSIPMFWTINCNLHFDSLSKVLKTVPENKERDKQLSDFPPKEMVGNHTYTPSKTYK